MSFEEFQDGHLWCGNRTNLAALNLHVSPMPPTKFQLIIQITLREQMSFQDFPAGHHGSHFRYWNGMNLAILNLHVTPMPPTMFGLNPAYHSGVDVVWRFSRWPPWRSSWILEQNSFSNSESPCYSDASHQVSAPSDLQFGRRCCLKIFKMTDMAAILDIGTEPF